MHQGCSYWAFVAAGPADQSGGKPFYVLERSRALAFGRFSHLEAGNQLTEILISSACGTQQGETRSFGKVTMWQPFRRRETPAQTGYRDLRSYMGSYPMLAGKGVKS